MFIYIHEDFHGVEIGITKNSIVLSNGIEITVEQSCHQKVILFHIKI